MPDVAKMYIFSLMGRLQRYRRYMPQRESDEIKEMLRIAFRNPESAEANNIIQELERILNHYRRLFNE